MSNFFPSCFVSVGDNFFHIKIVLFKYFHIFISAGDLTLHFLDVKAEVFDEYVKVIHPKYRGPVIDWGKKCPEKKYNKPFYTDDDSVRNETRQFMMKCDDDMSIVNKLLHKYQRKAIVVSN